MTQAPRISVSAVPASALAQAPAPGQPPVTVIGVPAVRDDDGARVSEGVPATLSVGGREVGLTIDPELARRRGFGAKASEVMVVIGSDPAAPVVVFVGCGDHDEVDLDALRAATATLVRSAGRSGALAVLVPGPLASQAAGDGSDATREAVQAVTEGGVLGAYRYLTYKSEDPAGRVEQLLVAGMDIDPDALAEGVRRGVVVAEAVCLARDLVNEPPSAMTPGVLARIAGEQVATRRGVTLEIWDGARIEVERLGGLLGVARGSAEEPRLLIARYEPDPGGGEMPHVVLVGKGITFDSGGLSLKTAEGMTTMKTDMSGAAAVLAATSACGDLGVRVRVTAIAPVTENMPGGRAIKPGDVLTIRNGKTIEVLNTDAEGRLVLADALSLAAEMRPDAIVDLATLTGACVVALGTAVAGVMGNDEALKARIDAAAKRGGEATWPLPMPKAYRSHIDSEVADMKNIGKAGSAGAIAAALLLERFVDDLPWAHLDIAGPARSDEDSGVLAKGGTGFGVRTLLALLEGYGAGAGEGAGADAGSGV
ncbi:MAG TPA: leucyl aminopeptidase [Acidimicrobiales bacterium]|nr:leucyl aminopeptidase [Acidimicrobiales bacterium]